MKVRIRFFAAPREAMSRTEMEQELPPEATVGVLLEHLIRDYPVLRAYIDRMRIAVNHRYAAFETHLADGDEIACLPPVGGG